MENIAIFWLACGLTAGVIYGIRSRRPSGAITGMLAVIFFGPIGLILALTETPPEDAD